MRILRGRRKPGRQRPGRQGGRYDEPNPLTGLVDERRLSAAGRSRKKGKGLLARITIGHVAFLLIGVALGAGVLAAVPFIVSKRQALEEEAKPPTPTPTPARATPTPTPAPARLPVPHATTPAEAVRLMFKAAVSGDLQTTYAQWEIEPDEAATLKAGQPLTLAEYAATIHALRRGIPLQEYSYTVKSQRGDEAEVVQKRGQIVTQIFSLHRRGAYWKIRYASSP